MPIAPGVYSFQIFFVKNFCRIFL